MIAVAKKINLKEKHTDFTWWQGKSYTERLSALEQIRQEYNQWKYADRQGFQRVYTVLKQT